MKPGDLLTTRWSKIIEAPLNPVGLEKLTFLKVKLPLFCVCVGCETISGENYLWVLFPSGRVTRIIAADLVLA